NRHRGFRTERPEGNEQLWQQGQCAEQGYQRRNAGQQTKYHCGDEARQYKYRNPCNNCHRYEVHGPGNAAVTVEHRLPVISDTMELPPEAVHVLDRVVDADAYGDGRDRDGHDIQWNPEPAHD